jgi:hypothetical protein
MNVTAIYVQWSLFVSIKTGKQSLNVRFRLIFVRLSIIVCVDWIVVLFFFFFVSRMQHYEVRESKNLWTFRWIIQKSQKFLSTNDFFHFHMDVNELTFLQLQKNIFGRRYMIARERERELELPTNSFYRVKMSKVEKIYFDAVFSPLHCSCYRLKTTQF